MSLPERITNFNMYIEGLGFAGLAEEITLPVLELETDEYRAAGMLAAADLETGLKLLKMEITLGEFTPAVLKQFGNRDPSGINARFLGAAPSGDGSAVAAIEISVRGRFKKLDQGTIKPKDGTKMKVEMPLTYYRYSRNGEVIHDIDVISGKWIRDGIDISSAINKALGLA